MILRDVVGSYGALRPLPGVRSVVVGPVAISRPTWSGPLEQIEAPLAILTGVLEIAPGRRLATPKWRRSLQHLECVLES